MTPTAHFPDGFLWGAATASYQIEGAHDLDGRSPSIWDTYTRLPGAILNGDNGDVACDHYHRMPADVALCKELNLNAYRFSVAWPRVCPDGGPANQKGIDFYARLTDELLDAGITPWLTLYHWDLPQALEDTGGWTNRDTAYRFVDYAVTVYDSLSDRVNQWTTLNEPWCSAFLGYTSGQHAPGRQDGIAGLAATHHLLLGHGLVVDELRKRGATPENGKQVGITLNLTVADPFDPDNADDVDAARRLDAYNDRLFLDPLFRGRYPDDVVADVAGLTFDGVGWPDWVRDGDLDLISAPIDALGVNFYHGDGASADQDAEVLGEGVLTPDRVAVPPHPDGRRITFPPRGFPVTDMGWEIQPDALTTLLVRLRDEYGVPPIYITENGAAYDDSVGADGVVHDEGRREFIELHVRALQTAIAQGVDVRGYFVWTLLDNFEWAWGYTQRFGIVHVDFETQARTPKDSARWFAQVAAANALPDRVGEST
ncbi:GH1 family beta-glucosidase [Gordonia sp. CPCC 205515]|uniref:GH1 family beta-glucosidase n=1 Tax=Gordonia sp. CPCC 205515 TaxID=3140791 RepID=UPI003AF3B81B